jgi:hypothetical protein
MIKREKHIRRCAMTMNRRFKIGKISISNSSKSMIKTLEQDKYIMMLLLESKKEQRPEGCKIGNKIVLSYINR